VDNTGAPSGRQVAACTFFPDRQRTAFGEHWLALVSTLAPRYTSAVTTRRTPRQAAGALIRTYRERAALTLEQLADAAGISRRTLQRYEAGTYAPAIDAVLPLALALGLDDEGARLFAAELCGLKRVGAGSARGAAAQQPRRVGAPGA